MIELDIAKLLLIYPHSLYFLFILSLEYKTSYILAVCEYNSPWKSPFLFC